jgi:hypothetical protein
VNDIPPDRKMTTTLGHDPFLFLITTERVALGMTCALCQETHLRSLLCQTHSAVYLCDPNSAWIHSRLTH